MNSVQNYGMTKYQMNFRAKNNPNLYNRLEKTLSEQATNLLKAERKLEEAKNKLKELNILEENILKLEHEYQQFTKGCTVLSKDNTMLVFREGLKNVWAKTIGRIIDSPEKCKAYEMYLNARIDVAQKKLILNYTV